MTERLGQPSWMVAPATAAVLDALEAAGGPGCARFVGGCVRNALIGAPIDDVDIATTLSPKAVTKAVCAAGLKAVPTGIEHGTVTAISAHRPYEITTLRRDVSTDGRRAVVAFTDDWEEDASRRDFTLNALYANRDGEILDPTSRGCADARAGRIVFVGEPKQRIEEDYLRILRFFRFLAWYGRGRTDPAALAACAASRDQVASLAAERISKELLKLLAAADPRRAVVLMVQTGVMSVVLSLTVNLARFDRLVSVEADPLLRLAALLADDPGLARTLAERLRLSIAERDRIAAALTPDPVITAAMDVRAIRRAVYRLGPVGFADRAKLAQAADGPAVAESQWGSVIALGVSWTAPAFPLTGEDAIRAMAPKGPLVGQALREVEAWWIDQDFPDDRPAALAKLEAVIQRQG